MSTARTRNRNQSELAKLVKNIDKRMEDFETSVEDLKNLKETITDMNDEITAKEEENKRVLAKLSQDLKENRIRLLKDAAAEQGKILICKEEITEMTQEFEKQKSKLTKTIEELQTEIKEQITKQVQEQLKVQSLEHDVSKAQIEAENKNLNKEIVNLNATIGRMLEELASQKKLTADVASMNRPMAPKTQ